MMITHAFWHLLYVCTSAVQPATQSTLQHTQQLIISSYLIYLQISNEEFTEVVQDFNTKIKRYAPSLLLYFVGMGIGIVFLIICIALAETSRYAKPRCYHP